MLGKNNIKNRTDVSHITK